MKANIFHVDAFTQKPFSGNPAAVCLLESPRDPEWMQKFSFEMNLSETAYLVKQDGCFDLRWFTPTVEVPLCGHATLASAHILWEEGILDKNKTALFSTKSGTLKANLQGDWIELDFPADPVVEIPLSSPLAAEVSAALSVKTKYVGKSKLKYLVEVESVDAVRAVQPDFERLARLPHGGVIVTSHSSTSDRDFVSRYFDPQAGVNEDPVCGSAHCCLGPYWERRLGKHEFIAHQISERGGILHVRVTGERIFLSGQATTIFRGELCLE